MLYKNELKNIPPCEFGKKLTKAESDNQFFASAKVVKCKRSGKVLIVDYYDTTNKELQVRFFASKKDNNHIIYLPKEGKWTRSSLSRILHKMIEHLETLNVSAKKNIQKVVSNYLDVYENKFISRSYYYPLNNATPNVDGFTGTIEIWLDRKREDTQYRALNSRLYRENFFHSLFEEKYPNPRKKLINKFYLQYFNDKFTYIFFNSLDKKGNRYGICTHCGKKIKLDRKRPMKGDTYECPKCGTVGELKDLRYHYNTINQQYVAISNRVDKYITFEFMLCTRHFDKYGKPYLLYEDMYRTVFDTEKQTYKSSSCVNYMGYYRQNFWSHYKKWAPGYHECLMYPDNLNEVTSDVVPYLDMKEVSKKSSPNINIIQLFLNLVRYPCVEYLYKKGLKKLSAVEGLERYVNVNGKTATDVLEISKQQIKIAIKYDISAHQLSSIKRIIEHNITDEQYEFLISNDILSLWGTINALLRYMRLSKLIGYLKKQNQRTPKYSIDKLLTFFRDYVNMNEDMGVNLNRKNIFPKYIIPAHDRAIIRHQEYLAVQKEEAEKNKNERIKQGLALINNRFIRYEMDGLCIVVPHSKQDFIREGQELSHCVGSSRYYENHIKGRNLIFFIREVDNPEIAKYTAEVDVVYFRVVQCYGYGNSVPPKEITDFIREFTKYLKSHQNKEIDYAEDLRSEKAS